MNKKSNKKTRVPVALALGSATFALVATLLAGKGGMETFAADSLKFFPGHQTLSEVIDAAADLNEDLAEEGMVLLKNDGQLPLKRGSWVSVFGGHASSLNHGWTGKADLPDAITTVPESLAAAGFRVNPTLNKFYEKNGAAAGGGAMSSGSYFDVEPTNFGKVEENSYRTYGDAAIIVLARIGGEGSDVSTVVDGKNAELYDPKVDAPHKALYTKEKTKTELNAAGAKVEVGTGEFETYHHALMLTKSEHELIDHVKEHFNKICVVINSSNAMELGELKKDERINGMIWMGCPGETGAAALGRILVGDVNPSGRLVDEFPVDFTADPTWCNFGGQTQVGNTNHAFRVGDAFKDGEEVYHVNDAVLNGAKYDDNTKSVTYSYSSDATYTYTDYEEDIYLGYRYYETRYEDMYENAKSKEEKEAAQKWYDDNVAFAFGEGLSYTTFDFKLGGLYTNKGNAVGGALKAAELNSAVVDGEKKEADIKKLYAPVTVTNSGKVAGKEVVQIYVKAPYKSGEIEKSVHDIVGFGKTKILEPGESETVVVEFNVQDFASWDAKDANKDKHFGDYELDAGEYTVRATSSSHVDLAKIESGDYHEYAEAKFELDENAHLYLDDFSGGELHNLFTVYDPEHPEEVKYKGVGFDGKDIYNSERTADMMLDGKDAMTKLSRADFEGTFPEAVKGRDVTITYTDQKYEMKDEGGKQVMVKVQQQAIDPVTGEPKVDPSGKPVMEDVKVSWDETAHLAGLTFKTEITDMWEAYRTPRLDYHPAEQVDDSKDGIRVYQQLTDNENDPWYLTPAEFDAIANVEGKEWTQAAEPGKNNEIRFKDLRGLDWNDPLYDKFLNQLTWYELISLFCETRATTPAIESVGKAKSIDQDGPNNFMNLFEWVDEPTIAATFNTELAEREGEIVGDMAILSGQSGWYGPGMDMHHTAFSGRNNEYYSQDGLQGGYIAAAVVRGAQSRGLNAMIKHLAFNDQDTNRGGQSNMVWTSEQNIRQYEIKMFQMAIQEGGAGAGMSGYGRICGIVNQSNYRLNHNMLQDEWGWKGYMITDGFLGMRWCTTIDAMIRSGFQIQYKTEGPGYDWISGQWDASKRDGKGNVIVPVEYEGEPSDWVDKAGKPVSVQVKTWGESYHQYYYARQTAKSVIYSTVNSNNWQNGYTELQFGGEKDMTGAINLPNAKVGVNFDSTVNLKVDPDSTVVYSLSDSAPEGLSIDDSGKISGKPTVEGSYRFKVTALIDYYIEKTVECKLIVESAFYWVEGSDDLTALKVGDEVLAQIASDVFTTKDKAYDTVEYSIKEGKLPAGLMLTPDGTVQGTVEEAGEFRVVAEIKATKKSGGGGGGPSGFDWGGGGESTTTEVQTFTFSISVTGDPVPVGPTVEEQIEELEAAIEALALLVAAGTITSTELAEAIEAIEAQITALAAALGQTATAEELSTLSAKLTTLTAQIQNLEAKIAELEKAKSSGGCGSSIIGGSVLVAAALAGVAAIVIHKKNKNDKED